MMVYTRSFTGSGLLHFVATLTIAFMARCQAIDPADGVMNGARGKLTAHPVEYSAYSLGCDVACEQYRRAHLESYVAQWRITGSFCFSGVKKNMKRKKE